MNKDHKAAERWSKAAREKAVEARGLHEEAANHIFAIRNGVQGPQIDLHGLHPREALVKIREFLNHKESFFRRGFFLFWGGVRLQIFLIGCVLRIWIF